jgi:hypothetical protein
MRLRLNAAACLRVCLFVAMSLGVAFAREPEASLGPTEPNARVKSDEAAQAPKPAADSSDKRTVANPDLAPVLSHEHLCSILVDVARAHELPIGFFTNLIWQESGFNHRAVSRAGAQGVAQFMPKVAERLGLENPFDARKALPVSGHLLRTLHAQLGNLGLAAAAYNAGPKKVIDWRAGRAQLPKETIDYVRAITGRSVESWAHGKSQTAVFRVAQRVPCHRVESFARAEQAERAQLEVQAAEELRLAQQPRIAPVKAATVHAAALPRTAQVNVATTIDPAARSRKKQRVSGRPTQRIVSTPEITRATRRATTSPGRVSAEGVRKPSVGRSSGV